MITIRLQINEKSPCTTRLTLCVIQSFRQYNHQRFEEKGFAVYDLHIDIP